MRPGRPESGRPSHRHKETARVDKNLDEHLQIRRRVQAGIDPKVATALPRGAVKHRARVDPNGRVAVASAPTTKRVPAGAAPSTATDDRPPAPSRRSRIRCEP